ncbi:MAG TPA: branched-chain amino acid ABC transporter substrate-binding protein [Crenotrichaceae bacterium]|nr:branched-chain amino acid ABC transporter substrate-binding protein [Crenotrichaceae bacterium]
MKTKIYYLFFSGMIVLFSPVISYATQQKIHIAYLSQIPEIRQAASSLDPVVTDRGIQGANLAIVDNNTTGAFLNQQFDLQLTTLASDQDPVSVFKTLINQGIQFILADVPEHKLPELQQLADSAKVLLFNVSSRADDLRQSACGKNTLHLLPSRAMRADALGQYLLFKRWNKWLLVVGSQPKDQLFAAALKRAAKRYQMKIVDERIWKHNYDARRTAQKEIPVFTQGIEHDVLVVADEDGLFGDYLPYRTWIPRPVVGTQGLFATAWHPAHEQWGALQLNNRFRKQAKRDMTEIDYGAWLAVRAIGEAASRTQSTDYQTIRDFMLSGQFALAGFKGRALSFRPWNGQLRQPVLLVWPRAVVSVLPLAGFLHPVNTLDTLGFDKAEVKCQSN